MYTVHIFIFSLVVDRHFVLFCLERALFCLLILLINKMRNKKIIKKLISRGTFPYLLRRQYVKVKYQKISSWFIRHCYHFESLLSVLWMQNIVFSSSMMLCSPIRLGLLNTKTSSPAGASFRLQKQPIFEILSDFPTLVTEGPSLLSNWHMAAIILKKEITGHNKAVGTDASCFLM